MPARSMTLPISDFPPHGLSVSGVPLQQQGTDPIANLQEKRSYYSIRKILSDSAKTASHPSFHAHIRGMYLHIPFCFHKCHYCDFYSIVDSQDRQEQFTNRLIQEIESAAEYFLQPLESIFVGGGTPTLLKPALWTRLLRVVNEQVPQSHSGEFTVEANPETVTTEIAQTLVGGGVNRVSVGAQSFNRTHLKTLERWHEPQSVYRSVEIFRSIGVDNINLDLIFGIPGQSVDDWLADIDKALSLNPTHLSCYGLMYEPNTPLTKKMQAGRLERIDQDTEARMFEATHERLSQAGFEHYEISNWAKPGYQCRHNLFYWRNKNWWPIGPSASGHLNGVRWKNIPRLSEYLKTGPLPPVIDVEYLDNDVRVGEEFMLGLRLIEGIQVSEVESLLQRSTLGIEKRAVIDRNVELGLLEWSTTHLKLTKRGLLLADSVLCELI